MIDERIHCMTENAKYAKLYRDDISKYKNIMNFFGIYHRSLFIVDNVGYVYVHYYPNFFFTFEVNQECKADFEKNRKRCYVVDNEKIVYQQRCKKETGRTTLREPYRNKSFCLVKFSKFKACYERLLVDKSTAQCISTELIREL